MRSTYIDEYSDFFCNEGNEFQVKEQDDERYGAHMGGSKTLKR